MPLVSSTSEIVPLGRYYSDFMILSIKLLNKEVWRGIFCLSMRKDGEEMIKYQIARFSYKSQGRFRMIRDENCFSSRISNNPHLQHYLVLGLLAGAALLLDDVDVLLLQALVTEPQPEAVVWAPDVSDLHDRGLEVDTARAWGWSCPEDLDLLLVERLTGLHDGVGAVVREPPEGSH